VKIVIKLGGAALEDKGTLQKCAHAIVELANDGHRVTVVHGGGAALTRTLKLLGKESDFVNGLRITDAETRDVALMVLAGMVNKSLVATACHSAPARSRHQVTTSAMWEKSVPSSLAGLMRFGVRAESQSCLLWRWVRMASTTT